MISLSERPGHFRGAEAVALAVVHDCPVRSSSPALARRSGRCAGRSPRSPPPTSAASPSRPRSSGPASRPSEVDYVIMGQVLMAGQGQIPARQAAVKAGIPMSVPSVNVNKVCLSGLNTIYLADQMIAAGEADIVVAGGMESMTNAPYLAAAPAAASATATPSCVDAIIADGLWCSFDACLMGLGTERYAGTADDHPRAPGRARREVQRAGRQRHQGRPLRRRDRRRSRVPQRKGDPILVETDEGVRPGTTAREPRRRCARPSTRTAPSPPATPRRSPTAAAPSS